MNQSLSLLLIVGSVALAGCNLRAQTLPSPQDLEASPAASLEFPSMFVLEEPFIDLEDYVRPWTWYATPGGRLSFLHPQSWEVDIGEWSISRTIHLTAKEESALPVDILFTVYPVEDGSVEQAMNEAMRRIREDGMTLQVARGAADIFSPPNGPPAFALYRTTVYTAGSALHVFVPRAKSFLEVEIIGTDRRLVHPLRILLESIKFRD